MIENEERNPRIDPQPGDVIQVRPWRSVYTRTVLPTEGLRVSTPGERFVVYTSPEERPGGGKTIIPLSEWQKEAAFPLEMSFNESEAFKQWDANLEVLGRASRLCRADGHHCLSCCSEGEAKEYERRAIEGEDVPND